MSDRNAVIAVLVGSLRADSHNRALAELAIAHAPEGVELRIVDGLGQVPFYNEDVDTPDALPVEASELRAAVDAADAILFVTPEYNGTIPGVLKNAIDWLSRPYGAGAMTGKPAGVIGASLGRFMGTWSRQDTRKSIRVAGARVVEDVEIGVGTGALGDEGIATAEVVEQLAQAVELLANEVAVSV